VAVDAGVAGTYDDSGLVTKPPSSTVSLMAKVFESLMASVAGNDQQKVGTRTGDANLPSSVDRQSYYPKAELGP
jgi:hypothetical protein